MAADHRALLAVADRRAEGHARAAAHGEQRDLVVEGDELLDDHPCPVAAHVGDGIVPRGGDGLGLAHRALPLARRGHDGLYDERKSDACGGGGEFLAARCIFEGRSFQAEFARGKVADGIAVHRQLRRARRGDDVEALCFDLGEDFGTDRLDLGHDVVGLVPFDCGAQRVAV